MKAESRSVRIPRETVNDDSVKLIRWLVQGGEQVEAGQLVAEIETSKAVLELTAPVSGYLRQRAEVGAEVAVGGVICHITRGPADPLPEEELPVRPAENRAPGEPRFSRKALALIEKEGLDLKRFSGRGLVCEADVLELLGTTPGSPLQPHRAALKKGSVRTQALAQTKIAEADFLSCGGNNSLSSLVSVVCRARGFGQEGRLAAVIFETARLLKKYPVFNSYYHDGNVNYYKAVNVGFVVQTDKPLKVPIIRDADTKDLLGVTREVQDLLLSYHNDELQTQSLVDGTFTITDLSGEGVFFFSPLINYGQAAVLGVGAETALSPQGAGIFQLILTFDHRLSEGRTAAAFLRDLRERLESYAP